MYKLIIIIQIMACLSIGSCLNDDRKTWDINFLDIFNDFQIPKDSEIYETKSGVRFRAPNWLFVSEFSELLDNNVTNLERCANIRFERDYFTVYVPDEVLLSNCHPGVQLLMASAPLQQCRDKGLEVPDECEGVGFPTDECPCPCLYRGGVQYNHYVVTTPNLAVFKHELLSMKLNDRHLWDSEYAHCLSVDSTHVE